MKPPKNRLVQLLRDNAARERRPLALARNDGASEATLYLYDAIDPWWGISAQSVAQALAGLDAQSTLHLRINSPGGDVFEGRAMATVLREFAGRVVSHVDGLAASAATTVALAASEVVMAPGAFWMIHNAWAIAVGDRADMLDMAQLLEKIDAELAAEYVRASGGDLAQITGWMDSETWFTAEEAVSAGFADAVAGDDGQSATSASAARWNLSAYARVPQALARPNGQADTPRATTDWAAQHAHNARWLRARSLPA